MAEQRWITLEFEDKEYELGFTKGSVRLAESMGFNMQDIQNQTRLVTAISILFYASFLAKNARIREDLVERIYEELDDKTALINELVSLYSDTVSSMMENGKNAKWSILPKK